MKLRWWAVRNHVRDLLGMSPVPAPSGEAVPASPRTEVSVGPALPGALVRLLPGLCVVIGAALVGTAGSAWALPAVAAIGVTTVPYSPFAPGYALVIGLQVLVAGDMLVVDPATGAVEGMWQVAGLVLVVHLMLVTSTLAQHVAWRSFVEWAVLARGAFGAMGAQAVAQSALLLIAWLRSWDSQSLDPLRGAAVVAVIAVMVLIMPRDWLARRSRRS